MNESAEPRRRSIDRDLDYLLSYFHDFNPRGHVMRLRPDAARWMGPSPNSTLRVSDAERNEVADRLSRHFADGRLDQAEFKERLDAAMSAKTQGDLAGLFDDLPSLAADPASGAFAPPPHPPLHRHGGLRRPGRRIDALPLACAADPLAAHRRGGVLPLASSRTATPPPPPQQQTRSIRVVGTAVALALVGDGAGSRRSDRHGAI